MKLYAKIIVFVTALTAAALWANMHFSKSAVAEAISAQVAEAAAAEAAAMAPDFRKAFSTGRELDGIRALQEFSRKTGARSAGLLAPDGRVLVHTNVALKGSVPRDPLTLKGLQSQAPVFRRALEEGTEVVDAMIPIRGAAPTSEDLLMEGLDAPGPAAGYLRAGLSLKGAQKAERDINLSLLLLTLGIAAATVLLSLSFARLLLRQVTLLGEGIRKARAGDYGVSVPVIARDELGALAESFNKLSRELSETTVSKRYLDSLLEGMPDPLIITDESGAVLKANKAAAEFTGYDLTAEQVNLKDLLEQHPEGAAEPYGLLSWSGRINELDLWVRAKDGRRRPAMLSAAFTGGEGPRQVIAVLKDMTRHRQSEARLAQYVKEVQTVNSELDSFAHTVSHDLKEPLRGIEMFSGMLLSDHAPGMDPQAADYLGRIVKASGRMRRLIDDLLSYARVARVRNPYENADTGKLAREAVSTLAVLIEERKASVKVEEGMPFLYCDPVKMRQLFENLLSNAVKYNDKPVPEVELAAERFGEYYWKFAVKDNGIGVPRQYHEEIFKMFKRLHARHEYAGGTGAGLAIVRKIAEEHGGKVWVESEEGKGSTFFALIPADPRRRREEP